VLKQCVTVWHGVSVLYSREQEPFTSEFVGSILATDSPSPIKRVNALLKVVRFLQVLRFPPTGKVDRVGLDKPAVQKVISQLL
jgi:hypothetical protein